MTWTSFYSAPMVFATMLPFWLILAAALAYQGHGSIKKSMKFAALVAPAAAIVIWVLLYVAPGVFGGVGAW